MRRSRKGNTILETALVFLPTMALLFALVDYSMVVFLQGTFKHAAREGVRFAVTGRLLAGQTGHVDSIKAVVQENSMGFLTGSTGLSKISVRFYDPVTFAEATGAGSNSGGNIVEVTVSPCAQSDNSDCFVWGMMAPLQTGWDSNGESTGRAYTPLMISARSSDRLEPPPGGVTAPL